MIPKPGESLSCKECNGVIRFFGKKLGAHSKQFIEMQITGDGVDLYDFLRIPLSFSAT